MLETMKAAIFDMDGTLIDSMTRWREMNGAFVRQMGIIPTEKQEADMMSMSGTMVVDYFKNEFGLETNFDALCVKACEAMEPVYSAGVPHKPGAAAYLTICFIGIPCITAYNIIASIFRGLGDSRSPMYFIAVACAANIGLDYLFMGALHMGPAGAALGTTLAQSSFRWGSSCGAKAASGCTKVTFGRRKMSLAASCASACRWPCRTDLSKSRFCSSRSLPTGAA